LERYRVGIILSIPEFDTYRGLERFATDPNKPENLLAFNCLCKQAETRAVWQAVSNFGADKLEDAIKLITGSTGEETKKDKAINSLDNFMDMSESEQLKIFNDLCESLGCKVDPET
jgi:hypothetical protein